jgi:hypothetical protein
VDQYDDTDSAVADRMKYFFSLPYPTRWELKKELGIRYLITLNSHILHS